MDVLLGYSFSHRARRTRRSRSTFRSFVSRSSRLALVTFVALAALFAPLARHARWSLLSGLARKPALPRWSCRAPLPRVSPARHTRETDKPLFARRTLGPRFSGSPLPKQALTTWCSLQTLMPAKPTASPVAPGARWPKRSRQPRRTLNTRHAHTRCTHGTLLPQPARRSCR